jgi:hypothetical protein
MIEGQSRERAVGRKSDFEEVGANIRKVEGSRTLDMVGTSGAEQSFHLE